MVDRSGEVLDALHTLGLCPTTVAGYPAAPLVATMEELGSEHDMRAVVLERWRSAFSLPYSRDGDAAVSLAALNDIVSAAVRPVIAGLVTANVAVLLEPERVAVGWGSDAHVIGVGWLPQPVLEHLSRSRTRAAVHDGLVRSLAPVVEACCHDGGISVDVGWSAVVDALQFTGLEVGELLDDTPAAAAEVMLLLDGQAPLVDRARMTAVAVDGHVRIELDRRTCCQEYRLGAPCRHCPVLPEDVNAPSPDGWVAEAPS